MSYQSLYRKYRPQTFDDVIGQESIVTALTNAVLRNKISHAFLLTGPRGTGKTTSAKLLAKAVNCTSETEAICGVCDNCIQATQNTHPDIVEIDAASNNGVDEIRNLIERVKFMPIVGKYKVFIIDEIHMLSQGAFNALLKTLEEPPEHVVFILATTEIHKVLPTIISRCQRFDFSRINDQQIADRLERIVAAEHREIEPNAARLIASLSGGGMRNALTILEQAMIFTDDLITTKSIYDNNGMVLPEEKIELFSSLQKQNLKGLLDTLSVISDKTVDVSRFVMELVTGLKDSLIYSYTHNTSYLNPNDLDFSKYLNTQYQNDEVIEMIKILLDYHEKIRFSSTPFVHFEIAMIELFEKFKGQTSNQMIQKQEILEIPEEDNDFEEDINLDETLVEQEDLVERFEDSDGEEVALTKSEDSDLEEIALTKSEDTQYTINLFETETIIEPEVKTTPVVEVKLDLNLDEIVQYMVSADKDIRLRDQTKFENIRDYLSNPRWAKESNLLHNATLALSGERFILVVTKNQAQSRAILDEINLYGLISFTEEVLGKAKQVFATHETEYRKAIEMFRDLSSKNELPESLSPEDFITGQEDYVDETEQVILDLFGDHLVIKE